MIMKNRIISIALAGLTMNSIVSGMTLPHSLLHAAASSERSNKTG